MPAAALEIKSFPPKNVLDKPLLKSVDLKLYYENKSLNHDFIGVGGFRRFRFSRALLGLCEKYQ
jgi:hypothetical protein